MTGTHTGTSAYELLSKPTLDLSDAEITLCIAELRKKRALYANNAIADTAVKDAKPKSAAKLSAEQKAANTAALLAGMNFVGD
jgi:hypothetical protein